MRQISSRATATAVSLAALLAAGSIAAAPAAARTHGRHTHEPRAHMAQDACANASTPVAAANERAMRTAVVCLINQQRTQRGLPPMRTSSRLHNSAQGWTNRMVATQNFSHGADFAGRITAAGFVWQAAGENIATGYATPTAVVTAWMASPDHCANILNPTYSSVGTGLDGRGITSLGAGPSTWTQDFALPMSGHAPSGNWRPSRGCPYA